MKKLIALVGALAAALALAACGKTETKTVTQPAAAPPATNTQTQSSTTSSGNNPVPSQGTMPSAPAGSEDANDPKVQRAIENYISDKFQSAAGFKPDLVACGDVVGPTELRCTLRSQGKRFTYRVYDIDVEAGTFRISLLG